MWDEHARLIALVRELAAEVREAVRPLLGKASAKGVQGYGASGDATFAIDEVAERKVGEFLEGVGDIAYYTEDRGLVVLGADPRYLLVIDPIDGTRPAAAGLEACCVSIAAAPYSAERAGSLTLADVFYGIVSEIKNQAVYEAVHGGGPRLEMDGAAVQPALSPRTSLEHMFWTIGFRGRPAEPLITVLGELVDTSSVGGGIFDLGSATYCIMRVVTGEMDIYLDPGQRMADEVDAVRERFLAIGHGTILNNFPYDVAAASLIASESGAVVTDAYGRSLDPYPLLPAAGAGQISNLVSANPEIHRLVLESVDAGMRRLAARYGGA